LKQPKKLKRLRRKLAKENVINHQAVVVAVVFLVVVIAIVIAIVIVVAVAVVVVLSRCWEKIKSHKSNKSYETKVTPATATKRRSLTFPPILSSPSSPIEKPLHPLEENTYGNTLLAIGFKYARIHNNYIIHNEQRQLNAYLRLHLNRLFHYSTYVFISLKLLMILEFQEIPFLL